jgi:hypothetical protein
MRHQLAPGYLRNRSRNVAADQEGDPVKVNWILVSIKHPDKSIDNLILFFYIIFKTSPNNRRHEITSRYQQA